MAYMHKRNITLLSAAGATGAAMGWPGGIGTFVVSGTLAGATVALEMSLDGGTTWVPVDGMNATGATAVRVELCESLVRASVTGGTAPVITAKLVGTGW
jgi:hypothetical protein